MQTCRLCNTVPNFPTPTPTPTRRPSTACCVTPALSPAPSWQAGRGTSCCQAPQTAWSSTCRRSSRAWPAGARAAGTSTWGRHSRSHRALPQPLPSWGCCLEAAGATAGSPAGPAAAGACCHHPQHAALQTTTPAVAATAGYRPARQQGPAQSQATQGPGPPSAAGSWGPAWASSASTPCPLARRWLRGAARAASCRAAATGPAPGRWTVPLPVLGMSTWAQRALLACPGHPSTTLPQAAAAS